MPNVFGIDKYRWELHHMKSIWRMSILGKAGDGSLGCLHGFHGFMGLNLDRARPEFLRLQRVLRNNLGELGGNEYRRLRRRAHEFYPRRANILPLQANGATSTINHPILAIAAVPNRAAPATPHRTYWQQPRYTAYCQP